MGNREQGASGGPGGDLWHVVITEFSYRGHGNLRNVDPLSPERLEFRFNVFELSCAPSVLAQTNQNFDWIIIIDRELSIQYRDRILQQVSHRKRTHLHEFSPNEDMTGNAWLLRYAPKDIRWVLTTLLDDDDALPRNFVEAIQLMITDAGNDLPALLTFGYKSSIQWELIASKGAPFGYKCSWHRGDWVRAAGVSMLCKWRHNLSVLALTHRLADLWFGAEWGGALSRRLCAGWGEMRAREMFGQIEEEVRKFRERAREPVEAAISWRNQRAGRQLFVDLSDRTGPIVMTNHYFNDELMRLLEHKPDRTPVRGAESFPNTTVRPDVLQREVGIFGKKWRMYWRVVGQGVGTSRFRGRRLAGIQVALWAGWRFIHI